MNWKDVFKYNEDGSLSRLNSNNQHRHVGWINNSGYLQCEVKGVAFMVHRIIYELFNGSIPDGMQVDHVDRNPLNNRIENLRLASQSQNQINSKVPKNNTTGYKGVLKTPNGKFQARLGYNGKKLYLGLFDTAEEANDCVKEHTRRLYGEFTPS